MALHRVYERLIFGGSVPETDRVVEMCSVISERNMEL